MTQDTLSDVLRQIHLQGTLLFHVNGKPPWVVEALSASEIPDAVIPGAGHVMAYHVVTSGACWGAVLGEPPVRAERGDVLVFARGDAHVLSSAPGMRADYAINPFLLAPSQRPPFFLSVRGNEVRAAHGNDDPGRDDTSLLCGFFGCDAQPFNPLLANLPRLLHVRHRGDAESSLTGQFIRTAVLECRAKRPGGEAVLERLSEMMFVDLVRSYLDGLPTDQTGWLAGLRDRYVGRALTLLHERPAHHWTVDVLADLVGVSRSTLYDRFVHFIGLAPMQYLTSWRMQLAAGLLARTKVSILSVALDVGYESEAAFTRAFKKATGLPPGQWRRQCGQ
ncbi:MAG: AraC family transcriptional regulator [Thiomonas sp.]